MRAGEGGCGLARLKGGKERGDGPRGWERQRQIYAGRVERNSCILMSINVLNKTESNSLLLDIFIPSFSFGM